MSLMRINDYTYIIIDDDMVLYRIAYKLYIFQSMWCNLTMNGLTTQLVNYVQSILD